MTFITSDKLILFPHVSEGREGTGQCDNTRGSLMVAVSSRPGGVASSHSLLNLCLTTNLLSIVSLYKRRVKLQFYSPASRFVAIEKREAEQGRGRPPVPGL